MLNKAFFHGLSYSVTCNRIVITFVIESLHMPDVITIINISEIYK